MSPLTSRHLHHVALDTAFLQRNTVAVARRLQRYLEDCEYDTLVACGMGSIPWVVALALHLSKPYVMVRKPGERVVAVGPKGSRPLRVVGVFGAERRCVFVDDTVASGGTQRHVVRRLEEVGAQLVETFPIMDYCWTLRDDAFYHRKQLEGVQP